VTSSGETDGQSVSDHACADDPDPHRHRGAYALRR
jgi:hypothetical protein